jgi:PAS domain S-box-containing protein
MLISSQSLRRGHTANRFCASRAGIRCADVSTLADPALDASRSLFETIDQAYCVLEVIFDDDDQPVDFLYLETNPAFVEHAGQEMRGRRIKEIVPDFEQVWIDEYGGVAKTGTPVVLESVVAGLGDQWFQTAATRIGGDDSRRVGVLFTNITERKNAQEALRESELRYRSLFTAIDKGLALCQIITDSDGRAVDYRLLEVNPASEQMVGLTADEVVGKTIREVLPTIEDDYIQTCARAGLGGESIRLERHFESLGRWIEVHLTPAGEPGNGRFAAIYTDITERRLAEDARRSSLQRQEFLLDLSDALRPLSDATKVVEATVERLGRHLRVGRCLYGDMDPAGERFCIARDWTDGTLESMAGALRIDDFGELLEVYAAGQTLIIEDTDGDDRTVDHRVAYTKIGPVRSAIGVPLVKDGRLTAIFAVHHGEPRLWAADEITLVEEVAERTWSAVERARVEQELQQSREQLKMALEIETVGVTFFELDGRITDANEAFLRIGGYTREDVESGRLRTDDLTPPEWQHASAEARKQLIELRRSTPYEKEYFRLDRSRWSAIFAATMLTETSGVEYVLDLTDLRAAEEATLVERRRHDQLERDFVANAAHELRTPLTAIIGAVDALHAGAKNDPVMADLFLGHLRRESARLARLADSLLLLAQADSLRRLALGPVALRPLLDEIAAEIDIPDTVTVRVSAARQLHALTHRGLVERIVANLVENAVKHTRSGRIELRARQMANSVAIDILDTGTGISEDTTARAFDRFYRGEERTADGFGLGLSIARQAAVALGGDVIIKSRREGGTIVRLLLPNAGQAADGIRARRAE